MKNQRAPKPEPQREEIVVNEKIEIQQEENIVNESKTENIEVIEPPKAVEIKPKRKEFKKESIIPAAFASTKKSFHLSRKPRSSNADLR